MRLHGINVENKLKGIIRKPGDNSKVNPTAFKGYPGLTHTAKKIAEYIPHCDLFVEPFAGLGRISKRVKANQYVLNDIGDFSYKYLTTHFKKAKILQLDYPEILKMYDSPKTYFFIDPPWYDDIYQVNPLTGYTKPCKEIYAELKETLPKIKGNWMIAGMVEGTLLKWDFYHKEVQSSKNYLFGHKARTHLVSNNPFKNYYQKSLFD